MYAYTQTIAYKSFCLLSTRLTDRQTDSLTGQQLAIRVSEVFKLFKHLKRLKYFDIVFRLHFVTHIDTCSTRMLIYIFIYLLTYMYIY